VPYLLDETLGGRSYKGRNGGKILENSRYFRRMVWNGVNG